MTNNDQPSHKPTAFNNYWQESDKDDTAKRIPALPPLPPQQQQWQPGPTPHSLSPQHYQQPSVPPLLAQQQWQQRSTPYFPPTEYYPQPPIPPQQWPTAWAPAIRTPLEPNYAQSTISTQPLRTPGQLQRPKRHRLAISVITTLVLLTILIVLGGYFERVLSYGTPETVTIPKMVHTGPFVQPPLNSIQIDALRHLITRMQYKQLASMYVARMSLDEELGQLIMVEYADTYYSPDLDMMINQLHAGGVIMYEFQMNSFDQTKHDIAAMQTRAKIPLLISTDEEGGPYVHRLSHIYGPRMSATDIANTGDTNIANQQGHKAAHDLLALGINENLAPDVDVNLVNGFDMVTRTFGSTPESVIKFAGAYMQALQSDGVVACIKHYPGLGDAPGDAHAGLPVVYRSKAQLYAIELAPFKAFIQTQNKLDNPGMIMPTDVLMPAIDPKWPAELSHIFMTDILRKQLGYDGVVLTDALYMGGIRNQWNMPEAAVLALNAGNDMLLGPNGTGQMIEMLNALKQALKDGTLSKTRVDEAATRIIALKMQYHLMPTTTP